MKGYKINAIQQVGVGTSDFRKSWEWYIRMFGFDVKILEDDTVAERMLPYTGGRPQKRHACIAVNLQGGGGLEIWQYSERKPQEAAFKVSVGDLGVFAAKLKCSDVQRFHDEISTKWDNCGEISTDPSGKRCFYVTDLYGNTFQIIERDDVFINDGKLCGGVAGAMVGVSDMDRAVSFYRDVLGYDLMIYDASGIFSDWSMMPGGAESCRRVLLGRSAEPSGAFAGLLGDNTIELVQAQDRKPRKIYEGRQWGDPGFIQICYDVTGMKALEEHCAALGSPFTVDSCPNGEKFDMGEASGHFTYIEDPDGTLIEFVETRKIPLAAGLGLYINLDDRNSGPGGNARRRPGTQKRLPKILFKVMGLVSRVKPME